jgi:hypothetical protein
MEPNSWGRESGGWPLLNLQSSSGAAPAAFDCDRDTTDTIAPQQCFAGPGVVLTTTSWNMTPCQEVTDSARDPLLTVVGTFSRAPRDNAGGANKTDA